MTRKIPEKIRKLYEKTSETVKKKYKETSVDYKHALYIGIGALLISYLAVFLVDILNVFGARSIMEHRAVPLLWNYLFGERGPIEMIQWILLGAFTLTSTLLTINLRKKDRKKESIFWLLFAITGVLMIIEDIGNIRHFLFRELISVQWETVNILETIYFGLIALLPIIAVVKYGKQVFNKKNTTILLILGFIFYGSAAALSGPLDLAETKYEVGESLYEITIVMGGEELREVYEESERRLEERSPGGEYVGIRYRLLDFLLEETLELL